MDNMTVLQEWHTLERQNQAVYLAMADALEAENWQGFSAWMRKSAGEEGEHAAKVAGYIIDRNGVPAYIRLAGELTNGVPLACFDMALAREKATTEFISSVYFQAQDNDPLLVQFLWWFLEEQRQSERDLADILLRLRPADYNGQLILNQSMVE